jgi:hypothetical protein
MLPLILLLPCVVEARPNTVSEKRKGAEFDQKDVLEIQEQCPAKLHQNITPVSIKAARNTLAQLLLHLVIHVFRALNQIQQAPLPLQMLHDLPQSVVQRYTSALDLQSSAIVSLHILGIRIGGLPNPVDSIEGADESE